MMLCEKAKELKIDFQQYLLKGQTIFEYSVGPLKERGFTEYYKDFIKVKVGAKEQREKFEANMIQYLNKGFELIKQKGIL